MNPTTAKWMRKLHRHASLVIAVPLLVVIGSGLLLMWKKEVAWIQPPTAKGTPGSPTVTFQQILDATRGVDEAGVASWDDVDRLDVRPSKGIVKVRANSGVEVQVDLATAEVRQVAVRRSDLIEQIHDGSWFHDLAKHWLFFPSGLLLLFLWFSGLYLWYLPFGMRRRRRAG